MKFLVILTLCFCAFQLILGQERRFGRRVETLRLFGRTIKDAAAICTDVSKVGKTFCNDPDDICASTGFVTCTGLNQGLPFVTCPPEKPYCSVSTENAACETVLPSGCPAVPPNFLCTGVGYYPDPSNCRLYYNCYKNAAGSIVPESLFCDAGFVFDPNSPTKMYCLGTTLASRCVTVTGCQGATAAKNIAIPYSGNSQFVALCIPGSDPYIYQCPTGTTPNLNNLPLTCTYTCRAAGLFTYSLDNLYYYECKIDPTTKKLTPIGSLEKCPTNQYFSTNKCIQKPL